MTKTPIKFVLRKETLRQLSTKDLKFAIGGGFNGDGVQADSGAAACPLFVQAK
jgi:hypothetical protein